MNTVIARTREMLGDCPVCQAPLVKHGRGGRLPVYCSGTCRAAACSARAQVDGRYAEWRKNANSRKRRGEREFICEECGVTFQSSQARRYCTKGCTNQASYARQRDAGTLALRRAEAKSRRRARIKGAALVEKFTSDQIFTRDKWMCGLCGMKIDPNLKHPDAMSASIDHITPLARGGDHSKANVQAAHLLCNSRKGDRG